MKKLLTAAFLIVPFAGFADETEPTRKMFVGLTVMATMSEEQSECFNQKLEECPTVWIVNFEAQNPEDEDAARECQQQAQTACTQE